MVAVVIGLGWMSSAAASPPTVPPLPLGLDVSTVNVGTWSEYAVSGSGANGTIRWAVVGRDAKGTTLEVSMPDADLGKGKKGVVVQRVSVAARVVTDAAIQVGDSDPLTLKAPAKDVRFAAPDPATKTADESVTVQAGTFSATHYHVTTGQGTLDYWITDKAQPLGLVKLTLTPAPTAKVVKKRAAGAVSMELVKTGSDAKAVIVKKPAQLDPQSLGAARAKLGVQPMVLKPVVKPVQVKP